MRQFKGYSILLMAALLPVFMFLMIGCGCKNGECKNNGEHHTHSLQRPTVTFVAPFINETGVATNT